MRKNMKIYVLVLSLILVFGAGDAFAKFLKTEEVKSEEIIGTFTLVLYGGRHINDLETAVFLDKEGDQYEFEPYAPEFDYRIKKGVPAEEALKKAKKFVSFHNAFWRSQLSKILDEKGNTIGFELRPLYYPFVYGREDLLEIYYRIKGSKVIIEIRLTPNISKIPSLGDLPGDAGGGF